jgi:uncharacterized protein
MSIADFLFPAGMQGVLALVFNTPDRIFKLTELLEASPTGRGNAQRQIQRLLDAGVLVEDERIGRQRQIRANMSFALYPELRSIVLKSFGVTEPFREALAPFASQIDEAFIFGSVAKGSDSHLSDIDLMVIGDAPILELSDAMLKLEAELRRPIHMSLYHSAEWIRLKAGDSIVASIDQGPRLQILPNEPPT